MILAYKFHADGRCEPVIERDLPELTPEEIIQYRADANRACLEELMAWYRLGCFRRRSRHGAKNCIDARWVIKWKMIDGVKHIRARLTVRGFKDREQLGAGTFSGIASRWGQRAVCALAAQFGLTLWSADISKAFCVAAHLFNFLIETANHSGVCGSMYHKELYRCCEKFLAWKASTRSPSVRA